MFSSSLAIHFRLLFGFFAQVCSSCSICSSCKPYRQSASKTTTNPNAISPCITSCVLGLVNTIYTISIRPTAPLWSTSSISCLTLSIISLTIYTILALLTFHRIGRIRERDITCPRRNSDSSNLLGEEERQKTQWMRLLSQKGADRAGPLQSTFHIDLPENIKNESDRHETMYLPVPQNTYEGHNWNARSTPSAERPVEAIKVSTETMFPAPGTGDRGRAIVRPPVITTTRPPTEVLVEGEVRLSEVHPLEREAYLRSLNVSHSPLMDPPVDTIRGDERSQSRESRRLQIEMTDQRRWVEPEYDVEGVQIVQRIQRVQTDGWPQGNMLK